MSKLKQIYQDLIAGKLTQEEAINRIKHVKMTARESSQENEVHLAAPFWKTINLAANNQKNEITQTGNYAQHYVLLCEAADISVAELQEFLPGVNLSSLETSQGNFELAMRYQDYALRCFETLKTIMQARPTGKILVQLVIENNAEKAVFTGIAALLKTAGMENPDLMGQVVLVEPGVSANQLATDLLRDGALLSSDDRATASVVKHLDGLCFVSGLEIIRNPEQAGNTAAVSFKDNGVYLITGGLGGLGTLFVEEILKQTAHGTVIITGRSKLSANDVENKLQGIFSAIPSAAQRVSYYPLDVTNLDQVEKLIDKLVDKHKALDGIIHSAGMIRDNFILKKSLEEFCEVLAPKVLGAFHLDLASRKLDLDFFVLFSSIAAWIGNLGQSDYAVANAFLDCFAEYRNRLVHEGVRQGYTRSINWPFWIDGGMSIDQDSLNMLQQATGLRPMTTASGMQAYYRSLIAPHSQTFVMAGDLVQMRRALLGRDVIQPVVKRAAIDDTPSIDNQNLQEFTRHYLCKQISTILKVAPHKIDPYAPMENYGIDSILAMNLINQLEKTFGSLPKTLFFEYLTINELSQYFIDSQNEILQAIFSEEKRPEPASGDTPLKKKIASGSTNPQLPEKKGLVSFRKKSLDKNGRDLPASRASSGSGNPVATEGIAIIGLSGRYPGSDTIEDYWQNLKNGKDCIVEIPPERWNWHDYYTEDRTRDGHHFSKWGGFIKGVDEFDPRFFNISPREAETIDPQERLFLQHAWMAIEDAGYTRASLQIPNERGLAGQVGVYVGVMYGEYNLSGTLASIANRVSYVLNIHGPSLTLDTMCSSSLTAIHLACQDLKQQRTHLAIAGGVNVSIHPNKYTLLSAGQFISSDGHCQSFGEGGDGYIPGEGVGAVILKRLTDAERDGNHIYGVIRGSGLNHGGKTNGYTVPNPQAQADVINQVLAESNLNPRHISYIEAHGTGTKLGDPIEIAALNKAFHQHTQDRQFCLIGSAKSNIGHCESAAGIAGVTKILLQMQHRQIVPSLHSARLNPHIDFEASPFEVNQQLRPWEQPQINGKKYPRIAGISSFGAGGSNAHILIEEYQAADVEAPAKDQTFIIPLSARTGDQLQQKAKDLLHFILARKADGQNLINLNAMAYTLQVGREAMNDRVAFLVESVDQLAERLTAYLESPDDQALTEVYQGQLKQHKETLALFSLDEDLQQTIDKWIANRKLTKLVELWVKGWDLDWRKLYAGARSAMMSLPAYPFARERYWKSSLASVEAANHKSSLTPTNVIHPLLHINTSDFYQQSYASRFTGKEKFFSEVYPGSGQKILLPMLFPEMARVALQQAFPSSSTQGVLEFRDIAWATPFHADKEKHLGIALFAKDKAQVDVEFYSQDDNEDVVHCQAHLLIDAGGAIPERFDIQKSGVGHGEDELFLPVILADNLEESSADDYILHPMMMDKVLRATTNLLDKTLHNLTAFPILVNLSVLRIYSKCVPAMFAWIRYAADNIAESSIKILDIDLCDEHGKVCIQLHGLQYEMYQIGGMDNDPANEVLLDNRAAIELATTSQSSSAVHQIEPWQNHTNRVLTHIPFASHSAPAEKPGGVALIDITGTFTATNESSLPEKTVINLTDITVGDIQQNTASFIGEVFSAVSVNDHGDGIITLQVNNGENLLSDLVIEQLLQTLDQLKNDESVKALILSGSAQDFLLGDRHSYNQALQYGLYEAIVTFPYPVIAAMAGDASGAGFLAGALCDFMILGEESRYAYVNPEGGLYPSTEEIELLDERFGTTIAQDFLYITTDATGAQLQGRGWNCPILPSIQVDQHALKLAAILAEKSRSALTLLKQHLSRNLYDLTRKLKVTDQVPVNQKSPEAADIPAPVKQFQLTVHSGNVLALHINSAKRKNSQKSSLEQLQAFVARLTPDSNLAALVITGDPSALLSAARDDEVAQLLENFHNTLLDSPVPVIAAFEQDLTGVNWLIALACDICIYRKGASYSIQQNGLPAGCSAHAMTILEHRFGRELGWEILCSGNRYDGADLHHRVMSLPCAEDGQVFASALTLAESWHLMPLQYLASWKKTAAARIRASHASLTAPLDAIPSNPDANTDHSSSAPVALPSTAVSATILPGQILLVKMEDRAEKNMFSDALVEGLNAVKDYVAASSSVKTVVLTGYENYFASGGNRESLVAIQEGKARFTDNKVFQFALDIPVPVIAAIQGHGIGAGWAMGMLADFIFLSEESRFLSPYMKYGFTPGAGSTLIFIRKIGYDLARETLFTARESAGFELRNRGARVPVIPRPSVLSTALNLAENLARISRDSLLELKRHWVNCLVPALEETYALEISMHEKTFVGDASTLTQIEKNFGRGQDTHTLQHHHIVQASSEIASSKVAVTTAAEDHSLAAITTTLRTLLARELHLHEHEIDEKTQFIDLGLDSITGVTWIRAINERYKTAIEATRVYSNPTLAELSQHVREEINKLTPLAQQPENANGPLSGVEQASLVPVYKSNTPVPVNPISSTSIKSVLRKLLAEELHLQETEINEDTQFIDLGLDSITGVTWVRKINEKYATAIEATKVYSHPTLAQLSQLVQLEAEKHGSQSSPEIFPATSADSLENPLAESAGVTAVVDALSVRQSLGSKPPHQKIFFDTDSHAVLPSRTLHSWRNRDSLRVDANPSSNNLFQAVAVLGMAGQFPMANNIDEFWNNIAQGKDCISEVQDQRWNVNTYYQTGKAAPGKTNSKWMGALEEYDLFDPLFFNISPTEAESMDPQQRVFLQACWHSIENAGYNPQRLSGSKCGVFVGCGMADYQLLAREHQISAQGFTGSATSILAARISYILNLQGPCLAIETACSSSLVAIATACDSLNSGASDLALAGGVCVISGPEMHIKTAQAGMLSTDGRCFTFDQRANGFVPGEAVGVLMLKRLADAQRDEDIIHGVIQGWGINQDGKTNGITAPNPVSQTRLQQDIYDKFKIDPAAIQLIEAHGTGTKLGDPIEIEGLKTTFKKYTNNQNYCALGSIKSNIGHTLPAAGVAGVIKILLALRHKKLPPTINFAKTNEHIKLQESPFYINDHLQDWVLRDAGPRQAAINSFGFSGTNAHMVIAEYVPPRRIQRPVSVITQDAHIMVPLSAKTEQQLLQKVRDLSAFIHSNSHLDLVQVAYTLQVGREPMEERLGLMVTSLNQFREKLDAFAEGEADIGGCYRGQVRRNKEGLNIISQDDDMKQTIIEKWLADKALSKLMDLWVKGLDLDWDRLYGDQKPRRICLPNYPFAKQRYWFKPTKAEPELTVAALHPLLHSNSSDLSRQSYTSVFRGNEFFLKDYRIDRAGLHSCLPGTAYLEMARIAAVNAVPNQPLNTCAILHNIVWAKAVEVSLPAVAQESKAITIALAAGDNDIIDFEIASRENEQELMLCEGQVTLIDKPVTEIIDIPQLRSQLHEDSSAPEDLRQIFAQAGIHYGPGMQGLTEVYRGAHQLLAKIVIPAAAKERTEDYCLHPVIIESAMQACTLLAKDTERPLLPRALESLTVISPCVGDMYAWIRMSPDANPPESSAPYVMNIDLCDQAGNVCASLTRFALSHVTEHSRGGLKFPVHEAGRSDWDNMTYVYRWQEQALSTTQVIQQPHKHVLIVCSGYSFQFEETICRHYQQKDDCAVSLIRIADKTYQLDGREWLCGLDDAQGFDSCLTDVKKIDALYFIAFTDKAVEEAELINDEVRSQHCVEVQLLRLIKSIKQHNKADKTIDTYLLTCDNYSLDKQANQYQGAGAAGLGYSLAQGNYQFRVRNLDLSIGDLADIAQQEATLSAIINEPSSDRGEIFKLHSHLRYKKTFFRLHWGTASGSALRQGGVYLIAGGSGIVGQLLTRYLMEQYDAKVVWLGRAAENSEKLERAFAAIAEYGHKPLYIQADVLNPVEMQAAVTRIKNTYGSIHGAIFSGMVFGIENSIDQTSEAEFREISTIKTEGSRTFYNALKHEPLDFMCYFSSGQAYSFSGASKLSAYAAGIVFNDSFVRSIQQRSPFPVGIINWGFWKAAVSERIAKLDGVSTGSLDVLEDQDGLACFERFIDHLRERRIDQVLCMRASLEVEALMNCHQDDIISVLDSSPIYPTPVLDTCDLVPSEKLAHLISNQTQRQLDTWFIQLLAAQFHLLIDPLVEFPVTTSNLHRQCGVLDKYLPWWNESIAMLARAGYISLDNGLIQGWSEPVDKNIWNKWQAEKEHYLQNLDTRALTVLIDECLVNLPQILQGRMLATDIIFPNSSIDKVAGLYKNNAIADTFNEIVANAVVAYLQQRLAVDPQARINILEIGAGTGGTSSAVFSALTAYKNAVAKYTYTDLSKAFFFHAEKNYLPDNPYIVCQRLNIEEPIDRQGIEIGSYDLVLSTNVLHATQNIATTLRHAKAALRTDGYLILNEMSDKTLSTHLTFGLLDGWWLFEDAAHRIPGCPGLYPDAWRRLLAMEGFNTITFPAEEGHGLGNQIILARSNGIARQRISGDAAPSYKPQTSALTVPAVAEIPVPVVPENPSVVQAKKSVTPLKNIADVIQETLVSCLSTTLKIAGSSIKTDIAFSDYGIDSILGVNFIEQINKHFSISLNTAVIFEYSSIERLSIHIKDIYGEHIETQLAARLYTQINTQPVAGMAGDPDRGQTSTSARLPLSSSRRLSKNLAKSISAEIPAVQADLAEIAIIGMSGQFPKAENITAFWNNLVNGIDGVEELPANYLDQKKFYTEVKQKGKTRCKWGGILRNRDCFDPLFFNISPKEAESMNPHQRLVMQESWNALEDAGYNPKALSGSQTGIFVGAEPVGYVGDTFTGISDAIIASRLSYVLNFNGPAFVVNTGCSSSGVAIHLACDSLRRRETDLILAGGVNACMHHNIQVRLDAIEMLSPSGRCFTFDRAGDGTIISEGIGMVVLKRLDDAIADGDYIHGIISGSGINQDGASNGITAPSGAAQEQLINTVYEKFRINPEDISYVEAHGTGTKLGDPVETNALVRAFRKYTGKQHYCAVGSAKSHIGHAAAAAGVIGLIKVLMSIKQRKLPRLLNFESLNPLIEFEGSPFFITTETTEWTSANDCPRMAAINSFGHSGTNVHMVVKEYLPARQKARIANRSMNAGYLIPLSAKTPEQLQQKAHDLLEFIRSQETEQDLMSIAYTLQIGREPMEERSGFVCKSIAGLREKLEALIRGDQRDDLYRGNAKQKNEALATLADGRDLNGVIDELFREKDLVGLLALWVKGIALDWNRLHVELPADQKPERVSLPGYPFAKERYWVNRFVSDAHTMPDNAHTESHPQIQHETVHSFSSIEDILNKIDGDVLDTQQGIRMLKSIV